MDRDRASLSSFLKRQSPVYIEQEILSISRDAPAHQDHDTVAEDDVKLLCTFLHYIEDMLQAREDLEFSQVRHPAALHHDEPAFVVLQVLLKLVLQQNMAWIIATPQLSRTVSRIQLELKKCWDPLQSLMDATNCMITLFSGMHE